MKMNKGFAGLFIKESKSSILTEAYFAPTIPLLLTKGAAAWWKKGVGGLNKFAQVRKGKTTATADVATLSGEIIIYQEEVEAGSRMAKPTGGFAAIVYLVDNFRKDYGQTHNIEYKSIKDLNFKTEVRFSQEDIDQAIESMKYMRGKPSEKAVRDSEYKGVRLESTVKTTGSKGSWGELYDFEIKLTMLK